MLSIVPSGISISVNRDMLRFGRTDEGLRPVTVPVAMGRVGQSESQTMNNTTAPAQQVPPITPSRRAHRVSFLWTSTASTWSCIDISALRPGPASRSRRLHTRVTAAKTKDTAPRRSVSCVAFPASRPEVV